LFHVDRNEVVIETFKVSLFEHHTNNLENGLLHITSRGMAFDSDELNTDLLKLHFNSQKFDLELFSGEKLLSHNNSEDDNPILGLLLDTLVRSYN
jgi:hypothetical protein